LALLVQTGIAGFVVAAAAIITWWRRTYRGHRLPRSFVAALAAMAVMAAFHDLLTIDVVLWWWALSIGLMEARIHPRPASYGLTTGGRSGRLFAGLVFAFIVLWGVVQPAWARWLWRSGTPDGVSVARSLRAEPWYAVPLEWRVRDLMNLEAWDWATAAEAISSGQRAVRIHPGAARLWSNLGLAHARVVSDLGAWPDSVDGARKAFARAVELEPHQPWAWLEWARLERNLGHTSDAADLARNALEAEPHAVRARLFLARLELDRGEFDAAREAYSAAVASRRLRARVGLSSYERELLSAPAWQYREIGQALK
jgi:hypothetical protein